MLLTSLLALSLLEAVFKAYPNAHTIVSLGWAGYVVAETFNEKRQIIAISASWVVPQVNVSKGDGYSSAWVGIGGQIDKTLIQVGTQHNVRNMQAEYGAWDEILPDYLVEIENLEVSPGDRIIASINLDNPELNYWNIQIVNTANGQRFNRNVTYNSTRSSGEWIAERTTVNGQISNLADFGSITFNKCLINLGNDTGDIDDFSYSTVHMTNQQYERLASASTLRDDSSFEITYERR